MRALLATSTRKGRDDEMRRIIKIKEHVLKFTIILLGTVPIFTNIKMYENTGVRNGSILVIRYIIYMNVLVLTTNFIEGKIVEYRVKDLKLNPINPYEKSLLIKYCIFFIAFIVISWNINIGMISKMPILMIMFINMVIVMIVQYILIKVKIYIGYKIMYGKNILVIGNKLYYIEGIQGIRDNFGSNFYMKIGSKEYEIFCGQLSTKKELMSILGRKITSNKRNN